MYSKSSFGEVNRRLCLTAMRQQNRKTQFASRNLPKIDNFRFEYTIDFELMIHCRARITLKVVFPHKILVASHFVPRSFRSHVISYLLWSFRTYFFGHFVPSNNHFVPRSFRVHFGHFVPRSTGYEMPIWWSIRTQDISYPFWSFRTQFGHFAPSKEGWMDGWMERDDKKNELPEKQLWLFGKLSY